MSLPFGFLDLEPYTPIRPKQYDIVIERHMSESPLNITTHQTYTSIPSNARTFAEEYAGSTILHSNLLLLRVPNMKYLRVFTDAAMSEDMREIQRVKELLYDLDREAFQTYDPTLSTHVLFWSK